MAETNETGFADQLFAEQGIEKPTAQDIAAEAEATPPQRGVREHDDPPAAPDTPPVIKSASSPNPPVADQAATPPAAAAAADVNFDDIPEEKLLEQLSKRTGRQIKSFEDLHKPQAELSDEEKKAQAEKRRSDSIEFAKKNNLFTQAEYDNYVKQSGQNPFDVVKGKFIQDAMKEDADLSQEEAEEMFDEYYHVHEGSDSPKYKRAQAQIQKEYDELQRQNFGKILDAPKQYDQYQELNQKAIAYKSQVEEIFDKKLPTEFQFKIDGEPVRFQIDPKKQAEKIAAVKNDYLTMQMMNSVTNQDGKVDEAALLKQIESDLKIQLLEHLVSEVAVSYSDIKLTKSRMGRKNASIELETGKTSEPKAAENFFADSLLKEAGLMA